jgi:hypothetical protein
MNNYQERRSQISQSLKIQPISHGQIYLYNIGMRSRPDLSGDRYEELQASLENHGSNLIPIVVRRTDELGDPKEYEVIHGADWVVVAEDMNLDTLWAWVFDLSDDQVAATVDEIEALLNHFPAPSDRPTPPPEHPQNKSDGLTLDDVSALLDRKLKAIAPAPQPSSDIDRRFNALSSQLEALTRQVQAICEQQLNSDNNGASDSSPTASSKLEHFMVDFSQAINQGAEASIAITVRPPSQMKLQLKREALEAECNVLTANQLKEKLKKEYGISAGSKIKKDLVAAVITQALVAAEL